MLSSPAPSLLSLAQPPLRTLGVLNPCLPPFLLGVRRLGLLVFFVCHRGNFSLNRSLVPLLSGCSVVCSSTSSSGGVRERSREWWKGWRWTVVFIFLHFHLSPVPIPLPGYSPTSFKGKLFTERSWCLWSESSQAGFSLSSILLSSFRRLEGFALEEACYRLVSANRVHLPNSFEYSPISWFFALQIADWMVSIILRNSYLQVPFYPDRCSFTSLCGRWDSVSISVLLFLSIHNPSGI